MGASWQRIIDELVAELLPQMVVVRRHLHSFPEPSGKEFQTTACIQRLLSEAGLQTRAGPEGRGVIADSTAPAGAGCVALRADIDALWIQDAKPVDYRSRHDGIMHACGHDGHTGTVLGALWALQAAAARNLLPWPVRFRGIFQPAEEINTGALEMIEAGALNGVQAILSMHMDPSRACGRIGVRNGIFTAACDGIAIKIEGRGGHAARPHESIDPIAAAAQLVSSIYMFVPRATDTHDPVVVTFGEISGGHNPNVIPEDVTLRGTIRTLDNRVREQTMDHVRKLARGIAETSGTRIQVEFHQGPRSVINDPAMTTLVRLAGTDLLGAENVEEIARPSMGGEDFANYLEHVSGSMFRLGCRSERVGHHPLHSPMFDIDETAMAVGARLLARAVVMWSNPSNPQPRKSP